MEQSHRQLEDLLEEIDSALTSHYMRGVGWLGYVLAMPMIYAKTLSQISSFRQIQRLQRISVSLEKNKRQGLIVVNLQGKIVGGGMSNFRMEMHIVDLLPKPKVIRKTDVSKYIRPIMDIAGALMLDGKEIIEPILLETATLKNIDVTGKTRQQILDMLI